MIGVRRSALAGPEADAYVNSHANKNEQTALHVAVQHGHTEAAKLLVQMGADVANRDINGRTPLLYSARYGRLDLLQFFWSRVADTREMDKQGDSVLHLAATNNHRDVVRYAVENGFPVNLPNNFGETALHKAARTDSLEMVNLLLQLGADRKAMGRDGKPRHVAQSEAVAQRLRSATAKLRASPPPPLQPRSKPGTPVNVVDVDAFSDEEEEDEEDDDVEFLIPGVRKIIEAHGTSPNSDLVHFKLKRAMEKASPTFAPGSHFTTVSDEQLAVQHDIIRKKSLATSSLEMASPQGRRTELGPCDPSSGVAVEMTLAGGSLPKAGGVSYLFEPYRAMFGRTHFSFICRLFGSGAPGSPPITAIASVAASADGPSHQVLVRTPNGYTSHSVAADEARQEMQDASCKLEDAIRSVLERNVQCADDLLSGGVVSPSSMRKPTTTPKTQRMSVIRNLKNSLRGDTSSGLWQLVEAQSLKMELLAVELKLGLPKTLTVGVVVIQPDQDEAAAMAANPMSKAAEQFLASIATPTEALGYSGYAGGMSTKEPGTFYYAGWRGMEIVFHVAPLMSETQRRQFIGNDKVLLYVLDGWREGKQLTPKFRGQVNSVAICVVPVCHPVYKFMAFHRLGMGDTRPAFAEDAMELDQAAKDLLMSKIVNAHVDSYNLLYSERMKRAWQEELALLADKYSVSRKKKERSAKNKTAL